MTDRSLSSLFGPGSPLSHEARLPDRVLLELLSNPDADRAGALAEIARRYGRMIWCVCHRSLREPADAEDAFQATLVALLENPAAARKARSLPAWLYGVTLRVGLKLKRREGRQRARDAKSARPEATLPVADSTWTAAAQALDEEVARLPASLRTAYLACESAAESHAELAARLGWNAGTLSARYSRARRRLEAKLIGRNLAPGLAGVGVLATVQTTSAVPWALADSVMRLAQTPVPAAVVAPAVILLAKEGVVMGLSKLKLAALGGVAAVGVGLNVGPLVLPPVEAQAVPVAAPGGEGVAPAASKPVAPPTAAVEAVAGQWEYEFAELPADLAGVKALLSAKGKAGWEIAGTVAGDVAVMPKIGVNAGDREELENAYKAAALRVELAKTNIDTVEKMRAENKASDSGGVFPKELGIVRAELGLAEMAVTEIKERLTRTARTPGQATSAKTVAVFKRPAATAGGVASRPDDLPPPTHLPLLTGRGVPSIPPLSAVPPPPQPFAQLVPGNAAVSDIVLDLPAELAANAEFKNLLKSLLNSGEPVAWSIVGSKLILLEVDAATVGRVKKLIEPFAKMPVGKRD